ncbi:fungal-specific transcription factor domain-containing protein [Lipomyces doorenjongii]
MLPVSHRTCLAKKTRVVSCTECHRRKQKCDRESPCNQCILRKVENLCHYANENRRKRPNHSSSHSSISTSSVPGLPLAQPTSGNPPPTLRFQSTASQLLPYQQSFHSSSDHVSPFYAAAAAGVPTHSVAGPSSSPAFETSDAAAQIVALAQHYSEPPTSYPQPHQSLLSYSSRGASDPGSVSTPSDGADDDDYESESKSSDDERYGTADLVDSLGYFQTARSSVAQDIRELNPETAELPERFSTADSTAVSDRRPSLVPKTKLPAVNRLLRTLPPRPYADLLIQIFFQQENLYQALNEVKFWEDVTAWWEHYDRTTWDAVETACLMFRVLATALYFIPQEHVETVKQIDNSVDVLARDYHAVAVELADMLPDSYGKVVEYVLRAAWYKYDLRMKDSWYCIGQAIRMAQEINLHVEPLNQAPTFDREKRRRLWWLLYYWDRCMALTLSRPLMITDDACKIPMPLDLPDDCYYPTVRPAPPVTPYTVRLISYRLGALMSSLDSDPQGLFENLSSFVAALPPYFRPQDPDTSLDETYSFLASHRNSLAATICMVCCAVYRRQVTIPNPMSFCLRLLRACEDQFKTIQKHHYRQFSNVYWNLEPSVLICRDILREINDRSSLAHRNFMVFGNHVGDNGIGTEGADQGEWNAWQCLEAAEGAVFRLRKISENNKLAGNAYKVLRALVAKVRIALNVSKVLGSIEDTVGDESPGSLVETNKISEESNQYHYYSEQKQQYQRDQSIGKSQGRENLRASNAHSRVSGIDRGTDISSQQSSPYSIESGIQTYNNNNNYIAASLPTPAQPTEKNYLAQNQAGVSLTDFSLDFLYYKGDSGLDLSSLLVGSGPALFSVI